MKALALASLSLLAFAPAAHAGIDSLSLDRNLLHVQTDATTVTLTGAFLAAS